MEFKIYFKSYYHRLPRLLLFSFIAVVFLGSSCKDKTEQALTENIETNKKSISFYENGKPKGYNLFQNVGGKEVLVGYQEVYENGAVKIKGAFNTEGERTGLWQSFYVDGKPWSTGEYINGVETGENKTWYSNGKMRYQGKVEDGKPIGEWLFWDENGIKTRKTY